uniref:Uncharacterized protein n=1 Tax=Anguilla anguilla TaxID=7936 RepID=A0A0E9RB98_ANGAN
MLAWPGLWHFRSPACSKFWGDLFSASACS